MREITRQAAGELKWWGWAFVVVMLLLVLRSGPRGMFSAPFDLAQISLLIAGIAFVGSLFQTSPPQRLRQQLVGVMFCALLGMVAFLVAGFSLRQDWELILSSMLGTAGLAAAIALLFRAGLSSLREGVRQESSGG